MNSTDDAKGIFRPHFLIMMVLFFGAVYVGFMLLPGENQRVAMLERDGSNRAALQLLERRYQQGDRQQRTLYQLQRLYELFGDLNKSRHTLEMLAEERPNDPYVQRRLGYFYKSVQDQNAYMNALRRQLTIRYSDPACRELIGLLRRNGNYEQEQRRIALCQEQGYRRADDLIRLGFLAAASDDLTMTAKVLGAVDNRRKLTTDTQKILLFESLLHANRSREAHSRGVRWLKGATDDSLALTLVSMLSQKKRYDLSIRLARDVSHPGDSLALTVAELMLTRDQDVAAQSYLRGWLKKTSFSESGLAERFITASLDVGDMKLAFSGAQKFGLKKLGQSDLAALLEAQAAEGDKKTIKAVEALVAADTLLARPLLGAYMAMKNGQNRLASRLLGRVDMNAASDWGRLLAARLQKEIKASRSKSKRQRRRSRRSRRSQRSGRSGRSR